MAGMTEEQALLADQIGRFLAEAPRDWAALAGMGLTGLLVPEAAGGSGGGPAEAWVAARAAGAAALAEPLAACAFVPAVLLAGEDAALAALAEGAARFAAVPEPPAGEVLAGVPGADRAQGLILALPGPGGPAPVLLDLAACPEAVVPAPLIDGTPAADIRLTPDLLQTRRPLPGGPAALAQAGRIARLAEVAEAAGAAESAVALTARYLAERRQFGRPLAEFQALRHRLVAMMIAAQEIEALGLSAAAAVAAGAPSADRVLAQALWKAATAGRRVAEEAVQLHGGVGVTREFPVNARFRRLVRLSLARGGADALLGTLAG